MTNEEAAWFYQALMSHTRIADARSIIIYELGATPSQAESPSWRRTDLERHLLRSQITQGLIDSVNEGIAAFEGEGRMLRCPFEAAPQTPEPAVVERPEVPAPPKDDATLTEMANLLLSCIPYIWGQPLLEQYGIALHVVESSHELAASLRDVKLAPDFERTVYRLAALGTAHKMALRLPATKDAIWKIQDDLAQAILEEARTLCPDDRPTLWDHLDALDLDS